MSKEEIYVSVDIEATGPAPALNSMISLGAVAFYKGKEIASFEANIRELPEATRDPSTMSWWRDHQEAWDYAQQNQEHPSHVMLRFNDWVKNLPGRPIFLAYPAGFDFTFVYWYFHAFVGSCPFTFSALDMKSYAMACLKTPYSETVKRNFPVEWQDPAGVVKHNHHAVDDAREQGEMFMRITESNGHKW